MAQRPKARSRALPFHDFQRSLEKHYEATKAKSTFEGMRRLARQVAALEGVATTFDLTPELVDEFIIARRAAGVRDNTIRGELGRLKALCSFAVKRFALEEIPFTRGEVLVREQPPQKLTHLSLRQLSELLAQLARDVHEEARRDREEPGWAKRMMKNPYWSCEWRARRLRAAVGTYVLTGARKKEVLMAWKEDVDFDHGIFHVSAERRRLKTCKSHRKVPIVPQLRELLEDWIPRSGPSVWLFPGAMQKGPWTEGQPGLKPLDQIKAACERAGITGGFIHLFRHSWLTHAEGWGIPQQAAQKITGITQANTLRYYQHADNDQLHSAVADLRVEELASRVDRLREAMKAVSEN